MQVSWSYITAERSERASTSPYELYFTMNHTFTSSIISCLICISTTLQPFFYIVSSVFLVDRRVLKMDGSMEVVGKSSPLASSDSSTSMFILSPFESCRSKCGAIRLMTCCGSITHFSFRYQICEQILRR